MDQLGLRINDADDMMLFLHQQIKPIISALQAKVEQLADVQLKEIVTRQAKPESENILVTSLSKYSFNEIVLAVAQRLAKVQTSASKEELECRVDQLGNEQPIKGFLDSRPDFQDSYPIVYRRLISSRIIPIEQELQKRFVPFVQEQLKPGDTFCSIQ